MAQRLHTTVLCDVSTAHCSRNTKIEYDSARVRLLVATMYCRNLKHISKSYNFFHVECNSCKRVVPADYDHMICVVCMT